MNGRYPAVAIQAFGRDGALRAAKTVPDDAEPDMWNVPYAPRQFFTDRDDVLALIRTTFEHQESQIQVLCGLGGIGKTQTAIEYANRAKALYDRILWIDSETEQRAAESYSSLATALGLPEQAAIDTGEVQTAVRRWLENHSRWLLIIDNANEEDTLVALRQFLPRRTKGHILLTSRAQNFNIFGVARPIRMDRLSIQDSIRLLLKRTGYDHPNDDEHAAAEILATKLAGLPLALEQAAAYICAKQIQFREYLDAYDRLGLRLLEQSPDVVDHASVEKTWRLNIEEVEETGSARDLLRLCALLNSDNIPLEIIVEGIAHLGEPIGKLFDDLNDERLFIDTLIAPLLRYSLILKNITSDSISIHPIVQAVLRKRLEPDTERHWAECIVKALNVTFPAPEYKNWSRCERLLPQARAAADYIDKWKMDFPEAGSLLSEVGFYLRHRYRYVAALSAMQVALDIQGRAHGLHSPFYTTAANRLAALYRKMGRFDEAISLLHEVIGIQRKTSNARPEDLSELLNNLAKVYRYQQRFDEAEILLLEALELAEKESGPGHVLASQSLDNLATLYRERGRYALAEGMIQRALEIKIRYLGPSHPDIADSLRAYPIRVDSPPACT